MRSILFKWLFIGFVLTLSLSFTSHPIYVSVTEIEHNAPEQTLEISCKIFTDDFEKTLRATYKTHVDLLNISHKEAMDKLVSDYVAKHLKISVNGKPQILQYKGYEQIEEAIYSYYQLNDVPTLKNITVTDNVLYAQHLQQINLLHVTVNGKRQSTKLVNPEEKAVFEF